MNGRFLILIRMAVLCCSLLLWRVAEAQLPADVQKRYKGALELVRVGDYERAKSELNLLIQQRGPLAPYASYHYANAAFRQRKFQQSRAMLKQLMEQYPDWKKMDEANYLFAANCMELGQYDDALLALQSITAADLRPDVVKLEQNFVPRVTDLNKLKQLNQSFPGDRVVGLALIDLIQRTASDKDDLELSDRLTNRFGVPPVTAQPVAPTTQAPGARPSSAVPPAVRNPRAKGYYNVAVMFPFRVDEFSSEKRQRANQYVYDLYNGIKLAKAKLQEEGITVNLFAYDLDNDANKALELVNSPAFAQTDLIIGPMYIEPNRIAAAYASQNNIVLLNPIATSSELVANQPLSFLAQPSMNQQARKVMDLVRSLNTGRRAAIYFGASRKDSLMAAAYQAELKRQNYQIVDYRKLVGSAQQMADAMQFAGTTTATRSTVTAAPPQPGGLTIGHVFYASSNEDDGVRLLDALSRRKINGPLIATASAFDFYKAPASTFTRRELYVLYPDYIDTSRDPVTTFQEEYVSKRNTIPSVYASEGYDMMLFFGRQLAKNGIQQRNRTSLVSDTDDYLLSGFDYTQGNDNQIVPIVKYEDGRFVKIN